MGTNDQSSNGTPHTVGRFELESRLGKGGMGEVWLSQHPELHIPVAVKLCRFPAGDAAGGERARFVREAQATAALDHPNVVRVYEAHFGEEDSYIVMGYVDGGSAVDLAQKMGDRLTPDVAVRLGQQVASGLAEAARQGIIHRDIKPSNILVTSEGQFKITDLGIARRSSEPTEAALTGTGHIIGTPEYMSPEQALDSREVDLRSDIYSLGATLYHLVTGTPAFTATSALRVMMKHVQQPLPHPKTVRADLPDSLCAVVCKMMEKQPEHRYQSYEELIEDLEKIEDLDTPVCELHAAAPCKQTVEGKQRPAAETIDEQESLVRRRILHRVGAVVSALLLAVVAALVTKEYRKAKYLAYLRAIEDISELNREMPKYRERYPKDTDVYAELQGRLGHLAWKEIVEGPAWGKDISSEVRKEHLTRLDFKLCSTPHREYLQQLIGYAQAHWDRPTPDSLLKFQWHAQRPPEGLAPIRAAPSVYRVTITVIEVAMSDTYFAEMTGLWAADPVLSIVLGRASDGAWTQETEIDRQPGPKDAQSFTLRVRIPFWIDTETSTHIRLGIEDGDQIKRALGKGAPFPTSILSNPEGRRSFTCVDGTEISFQWESQ